MDDLSAKLSIGADIIGPKNTDILVSERSHTSSPAVYTFLLKFTKMLCKAQ